jgi:hypothetical protein
VLARRAPLVECGAGTGYWTVMLQANGVDIAATDLAPPGASDNKYHDTRRRPWSEMRAASAVDAVRSSPGRTLFLCWSPYDDDDASYAALAPTGAMRSSTSAAGRTGRPAPFASTENSR